MSWKRTPSFGSVHHAWISGLDTRGTIDPLPSGRSVITYQSFSQGWKGVDTNFVLRARGGLRINGGTSTGHSFSNTCSTVVNGPSTTAGGATTYHMVRFGGGAPACAQNDPWRTNVRGSLSYTIPWVDVLASTVFQSLPGPNINANMTFGVSPEVGGAQPLIVWEQGSEWRVTVDDPDVCVFTGCLFTGGDETVTVNLLGPGNRVYGSRYNVVDLKLAKNIRFARRRVNHRRRHLQHRQLRCGHVLQRHVQPGDMAGRTRQRVLRQRVALRVGSAPAAVRALLAAVRLLTPRRKT